MAVSKAKKNEILEVLKGKFSEAKSIGFTSNSGLTVAEVSELKNDVRSVGGEFMLAKKTLIKIAAKEVLKVELTDEMLPGQIGIVLSNEDVVSGLGKTNDFLKKVEKVTFVSGVVEGAIQSKEEISLLASMPSRETLLGRLVGSFQSPLSGLARFFDAAAKELETQGKETVGQLESEKKADETAEAPAEEKKEETEKTEA